MGHTYALRPGLKAGGDGPGNAAGYACLIPRRRPSPQPLGQVILTSLAFNAPLECRCKSPGVVASPVSTKYSTRNPVG